MAALVPHGKPKASQDSKRDRPRVLYVEDEDVNWEIAELRLRKNYDIRRARHSDECFRVLLEFEPHVILMDIQLKNSLLNGIELTEALTGRKPDAIPRFASKLAARRSPPVVFVTAYAASYSESDLRQRGGTALLTKPVNFTSVCLTLSKIIARGLNQYSPPRTVGEKRAEPRVQTNSKVQYTRLSKQDLQPREDSDGCGTIKNMSETGILVEADAGWFVGDMVELRFEVRGQCLSPLGRVVRRVPRPEGIGFDYGVEFVKLSASESEALHQFCNTALPQGAA